MKPQPLIMQKLYIHNKPVILYSEDDNIKKEELNFLNITQPAPREIPSILKDLDKESTNGIRIKTNQSNAFLEALFSYFQHWKAAGGLITNPKGEILLLFRRGKWDLPKGKMEAGEKPEETAIREVTEETGLKNISIVKKLTDTWHSYPISVYGTQENNDQKDVLKQTFWFQMDFTGEELTIPQIEEDIIDIQWIKPENIHRYIAYSYPNLKLVFEAAGFVF